MELSIFLHTFFTGFVMGAGFTFLGYLIYLNLRSWNERRMLSKPMSQDEDGFVDSSRPLFFLGILAIVLGLLYLLMSWLPAQGFPIPPFVSFVIILFAGLLCLYYIVHFMGPDGEKFKKRGRR
jgi:sterol desaturase/sphingolipid hydroxylase (fatty acid hydroxylase superfamily)